MEQQMQHEDKRLKTAAEMVKDELDRLKSERDSGLVPTQALLDNIKVLEFILSSPDPESYASRFYQMARFLKEETTAFLVTKSKVADKLGWGWR